MKVTILLSALAGLASAAPSALAGAYYEQWWDEGCNGRALLGGSLTQGYCTIFEDFPGKSIKITQTNPCPIGTSPQITISSTNDCNNDQPDWTFAATSVCINVSIQPSAVHLNCV
ncbi:hypothetical protein TrVFT333_002606 [Trichoderma virens FT-333]|nr:hypothetical protein TrVFT333_002606 [Trichoderma virens FT-333]